MNIYQCCYENSIGYGCRIGSKKWMFVPELGQLNNTIYKNIPLNDLVFRNPFEKNYEQNREKQLTGFLSFLKSLFNTSYRPATIGGLLFISH